MPAHTPQIATFGQRALGTAINLAILVVIGLAAESLSANSGAPTPAAQAVIASKTLFGIWILFWLGCGQVRSSPGLALLKLRVVDESDPTERISLTTALLRPLPYGLFLMMLAFPVQLMPASLAPVQFLMVLVASLFLAANSTPLWSGPDRRSLLDKWFRTRVIVRG